MANNDFHPDLSKLDQNYQILTELHGEGDSRTYLARHLRLNRDVTISVFRASDSDQAKALTQFASDVRRLTEARHPNVVPTIEGVWLGDRTFATVRARVRGATLDQSLAASGPMSIADVASTIHDINAAVTWARETGIAQRDVAPWDIVFQQGSGRTLLSFAPGKTAIAALRTECDDAQTVRRLAIEMLSGEIDRSVLVQDVAVPRTIPSNVADALADVRACTPRDVAGVLDRLMAALDTAASSQSRNEKTRIASAAVVAGGDAVESASPGAERVLPTVVERSADALSGPISVITPAPRRRKVAAGQSDEAVVVRKPSFGFNARLGTAVVAVGLATVLGVFLMRRTGSSPATVAGSQSDTGASAAGEVALHTVPLQEVPRLPVAPPAKNSQVVPTVTDSMSASRPSPMRAPVAAPVVRDSSAVVSRNPIPNESTTTRKKPVVLDSAAEAERQFRRDSAADVADPCLSAESSSQRRCLFAAIEKNDRELNVVYARLIAALRRQAGAASADPDPDSVEELRAAQRKWVDARDVACRDVGEEPLYAKSRAACFAQQSSDRTRELRQRLEAIPPAIQFSR